MAGNTQSDGLIDSLGFHFGQIPKSIENGTFFHREFGQNVSVPDDRMTLLIPGRNRSIKSFIHNIKDDAHIHASTGIFTLIHMPLSINECEITIKYTYIYRRHSTNHDLCACQFVRNFQHSFMIITFGCRYLNHLHRHIHSP